MPSPLRQSKKVWLITKRVHEITEVVGVCTTFRSAYKIALFELGISDPCLPERRARIGYRRTGFCYLFDKTEYEILDTAMYSPIGKVAWLQEVNVRQT